MRVLMRSGSDLGDGRVSSLIVIPCETGVMPGQSSNAQGAGLAVP